MDTTQEDIILSEVSQVQKVKGCMFLSYMEDISNTNTCIIIYAQKFIQNMFLKAGLLEESKGGGKEEKNDRKKNNEIHHFCVGTRTETLKTAEQYRVGEKGEEE
jgi:hypothetical protein